MSLICNYYTLECSPSVASVMGVVSVTSKATAAGQQGSPQVERVTTAAAIYLWKFNIEGTL